MTDLKSVLRNLGIEAENSGAFDGTWIAAGGDLLQSINPATGQRQFVIISEQQEITIGRDAGNDLPLTMDPMVSARHACIVREGQHFWLADLDRVDKGQSIKDGNIQVDQSGVQMTVHNVTPEYHGIYHCVMETTSGETYMVKWGINMRGPYFVDLWDKYEMNVIIGFSAMGGFLVLAGLIFGVYHFRWIDPNEGTEDSDGESYTLPTYENRAYTIGDEPVVDSKSARYDDGRYFESNDMELTKRPPLASETKDSFYNEMVTPVKVDSAESYDIVNSVSDPNDKTTQL